MKPALPAGLRIYIALISGTGVGWLAYLAWNSTWELSTLAETGFFYLLVIIAGSFPLSVAPRVKADLTTAVLFAATLLLEPGPAVIAGAAGILTYTFLIRFWGERLRLPWYKYPFNAGATALYVGLTALAVSAVGIADDPLAPGIMAPAATMYLANTALITGAASLQMRMNPLSFWWAGTRENGPAELSLLAFGFLGAVAYRQSPWTVIALFIPTAIIYVAFSRLARSTDNLEKALGRLQALQGQIASTAKLASVSAMSLDMAHQIKNPLAILLGRMEILKDRLAAENSPYQRHLDIAMRAGERIKEITQSFTSIGNQKPIECDMREILNEAYGIAGLRNRRQLSTRWDLEAGLPKVSANPVLLREAFQTSLPMPWRQYRKTGL